MSARAWNAASFSQVEIKAELPGMDAGSVEVKVANGMLTIRAEKKGGEEEKRENSHLSERRFIADWRLLRITKGYRAKSSEKPTHKQISATFLVD